MKQFPTAILGLAETLRTYPEDSLYYGIAKTIVREINCREHLSSNYLARACNVSKTSLTRFCRDLGYDTLSQFRDDLLRGDSDVHRKYSLSLDSPSALKDTYFDHLSESLAWMKSHLDTNLLFQLARDIVSHEHVYLFGNAQSANSADSFMSTLLLQGKYVQVVPGKPEEERAALRSLKPDSIVVVLSVYGTFFSLYVDRDAFAGKPENTRVYWLTCAAHPEPPTGVDYVLRCSDRLGFDGGNLCTDIALNLLAQYCFVLLHGASPSP